MKLIRNDNTEPYRNMATEEVLLRSCTEETVMFWRNEKAVIIGKNQNAREQVNFDFTKKNGIKVVRRLTGGGAVFHDPGNVNYTFITPAGSGEGIDFVRYSAPILAALSGLGISAALSGRNDLILADGRKFSGAAACSYEWNGETRLLHHGTLLFSADLSALTGALAVDPEKIASKGIDSVRSRVANLSESLSPEFAGMDAVAFKRFLENGFLADGAEPCDFSEEQKREIETLTRDKYEKENWLFAARTETPSDFRKKRFDYGTVEVSVTRQKEVGMSERIASVHFSGDFFGTRPIAELAEKLVGIPYSRDAVLAVLKQENLSAYLLGATPEEIADLII